MPTAYGRRREVSSDLKRRTQPHERYTASTTANSKVAAHASKETTYETSTEDDPVPVFLDVGLSQLFVSEIDVS